jgi:hypothetical protein
LRRIGEQRKASGVPSSKNAYNLLAVKVAASVQACERKSRAREIFLAGGIADR